MSVSAAEPGLEKTVFHMTGHGICSSLPVLTLGVLGVG